MLQIFKKKKKNEIVLLVCFGILFICVMGYISATQNVGKEVTDIQGNIETGVFRITEEDVRTVSDEADRIDLSDYEDDYVIDKAGDYVLTGEFEHTVYVDVEEKIVHLFLDNVRIDATKGAAIQVVSAAKVVITLLPGTENVLIDAPIRELNPDAKAAVMSQADLTINGEGKLVVCGYYEDGIRTKDVLKLLGGEIHLQAKKDGLRGSDGALLSMDRLHIESEGNGVYTANTGKTGKGNIEIAKGDISVIAGEYGFFSQGDLSVYECHISGKGVRGLYHTEGQCSIEEGCMDNE